MELFLNNLDPIATILGGIFLVVLPVVNSKLKSDYLKRLLVLAEYIVRETYQTIVGDIKEAREDGKLTTEEKEHIKKLALAKLRSFCSWPLLLWFFGGKASRESLMTTLLEGSIDAVRNTGGDVNPT